MRGCTDRLKMYALIFLMLAHGLISAERIADPILDPISQTQSEPTSRQPKKPWTIIVYIAADNDLRGFAARNLKQMSAIGSNNHCNIVAHLDIRMNGNKKATRRYFIQRDTIMWMNADDPHTQQMDSGDSNTLISCCQWAIQNYPAENYMLVFWNHGTGIIDPATGRIINSVDLFTFNNATHKLDLDRSIGFLDFITILERQQRGICWDDSTGHYLTNQKLEEALSYVSKNYLNGGKFSIIAFDACLMSMLEIANIVKPYASVMVSSQEVELSTGWNYSMALSQFLNYAPNKYDLARNIVKAYGQAYENVTDDYTQSALNLETISSLESKISALARLLMECLKKQSNNSVKNAIYASSNKLLCTHFDEPSYIDLHHFLTNLLANLKLFTFNNPSEGQTLINAVRTTTMESLALLQHHVIAYACGKNVKSARGISIYFPDRRIHPSYRKTNFAASNEWAAFLTQYLLG